jgi:hypothetical protein
LLARNKKPEGKTDFFFGRIFHECLEFELFISAKFPTPRASYSSNLLAVKEEGNSAPT